MMYIYFCYFHPPLGPSAQDLVVRLVLWDLGGLDLPKSNRIIVLRNTFTF